MAARAEKAVAERAPFPVVVLAPPKVEEGYIAQLSKFSFEEAFGRAQAKEGYWFRLQSGDVFVLFVGTGVEKAGPESVSTSLYILDAGMLRLVGFLDVKLDMGEATCFEPCRGTGRGNAHIEAADRARDSVSGLGYRIDESVSKSSGHGDYSGLGRLLIAVQGENAQRHGFSKFGMYTPTVTEFEIMRNFFSEKGAKEMIVRVPENKGDHYRLFVDMMQVDFTGKPPNVTKSGQQTFAPADLGVRSSGKTLFIAASAAPISPVKAVKALRDETGEILIPFRDLSIDDVTISLAESKEGLRIKMSSGDVFALFIREMEESLPGSPHRAPGVMRKLTVSLFHVKGGKLVPAAFCDRTILPRTDELFRAAGADGVTKELEGSGVRIIGSRRVGENWEFKDANGKDYLAESDGKGGFTVFRRNVLHGETRGPPVEGSDPDNPHIREMDEALRAAAQTDSAGRALGYGTAKDYSSHRGGKFSKVGRFALTISEMMSRRAGVETSHVQVARMRDSLDWIRGIWGNAIINETELESQSGGPLNLDLGKWAPNLEEIVPTGQQTKLGDVRHTKQEAPQPPSP